MTVLVLSKSFQASHLASLKGLKRKEHFKYYIKNDKAFVCLLESIKTILTEDQHVVVRGLVNNSELFFEALTEEFGVYYGVIEKTGIKLQCNYTGCNRKALKLHNDDAIDLYSQPEFGFIQVIKPDPILEVKSGVVIIKELVKKLQYEDAELLENLLNISVPMLSYGINYVSGQRDEIFIKEPILYIKNNSYHVRFDDDRIAHYYYKTKTKQSFKELNMIERFLKVAHQVKHEYHLHCGDILIQNNLKTIHDRSECSLEVNEDGSYSTREIMVSFAR